MDYFKEVYLKRMNIDGHTRQERVLTRKEKEFDKLFCGNHNGKLIFIKKI